MTEAETLARLRDIHLPPPTGWWPLAPGWYVLIILLLLSAGLGIVWGYRWYSRGRAKRLALKLLAQYEAEYRRQGNNLVTGMHIAELLRRVALAYFPRDQVAGLQGEAWTEFLNNNVRGVDFNTVRECILDLPYRPGSYALPSPVCGRGAGGEGVTDLQPLFACARAWIKQRGIPCSS